MRRYELLGELRGVLAEGTGCEPIVVCNIGYPSRELFELGDHPRFFYMLGSMGLASSSGAGIDQVFDLPGEQAARTLRDCLLTPGPQVIVAHVSPGNATSPVVSLPPAAIRDRLRAMLHR